MIAFEFKNNKYPIKINYLESLRVLPEKFGINLSKMFTDPDASSETMQALTLDDEKTLKLAWYYVEPSASFPEEEFLEQMTGKDLERFREDFWSAVVNFSGPLKKNLLMAMWDQFKRDIKKAEFESPTSDVLPSDSNQEG
jgi:hypothetical protein